VLRTKVLAVALPLVVTTVLWAASKFHDQSALLELTPALAVTQISGLYAASR